MPVYVDGYKQMVKASALADRALKKEMRDTFRKVGEPVAADAAMLIGRKDPRSAAKVKIRVRQRGVIVEQSLRRTTGNHPEWGRWQMRHAFLPAQTNHAADSYRALEQALNHVCDLWERSYPV